MSEPSREKLIVCSVVGGRPGLPVPYLRVQAWGVASLEDNLRRERRELPFPFLPVAAFPSDPEKLRELLGLPSLPASVWIGYGARWFGKAPVIRPAQGPIFRHMTLLGESVASQLLISWALAVAGAT